MYATETKFFTLFFSYGRCLSYIPIECGEFLDHDLLVFFDLSYAFDHNRQLNIQAQRLFKKIYRRANRYVST